MPVTQQRVAMITGGNSGIGFATASKLAAKGFHVILVSRNQQTSARAIARMRADNPNASVESIPLDLASFAAVRQCAAAFQAKGYPLHILINNAGGFDPGKQASFSADGFELTLATNHLGHFLLTNLLLDDLKRSAPARVITVSSQLHIPGYGGGKPPDFDYDNLKGEKYYNANIFYRNSKLANMWFVYELQRRLTGTGVTSNAVCPASYQRQSPTAARRRSTVLCSSRSWHVCPLRVHWSRLPPQTWSPPPIPALKVSAASSSSMAKSDAQATIPTTNKKRGVYGSRVRPGVGFLITSSSRADPQQQVSLRNPF